MYKAVYAHVSYNGRPNIKSFFTFAAKRAKGKRENYIAVWAVSPYGRKIWAEDGSSDSRGALRGTKTQPIKIIAQLWVL
ncbi:predicted protein [Sclerotinia sclerotiorum 1980 UF-70]|uniref:Uncharacterized protein n=1 Tax=Sclerotinia sclerotiorum (strain ATCC 18683 / 1980 / Ss-1) TaxID=665079 RepID=A7EHF8_SCLS1|nr:predicted protein [Sclerotinia sclerotiorum 1980 UF-70]EDO02274.1 predicted protein [Sclerotinia sclerotiorum 1980 UF-70]